MSNKITIYCPHCEKQYNVTEDQLGKKAACKACGKKFILQSGATPESVVFPEDDTADQQEVSQQASAPSQEPKKGFFGRLKDKASEAIESAQDNAARTIQATFVEGPCAQNKDSRVTMRPVGSDLVLFSGMLQNDEILRVPLSTITTLENQRTEALVLHLEDSPPLVVGKTMGNSVDGMSQKILSWKVTAGLLSEEEVEEQQQQIVEAVQESRDLQKTQRQGELQVKYLHGPFDTKPNSPMFLTFDESNLIASSLSGITGRKEAFRIPLSAIKGTEIDTSERMTLARAALLGIFAFGMKKKDKLLRVEFDDGGAEASIIFGKTMGVSLEEVSGRIMAARRGCVTQDADDQEPSTESKTETQTQDIAESIQKLAALRDQGILTEEEFTEKKAELLSRM